MSRTISPPTTAQFREFADSLPDIVWSAPAHGRRADFMNQRWFDLAGETHADPDRWRDMIHPDDRERVVAEWQRSVAAGVQFEADYRIAPAGTTKYRWYVGRAVPAYSESGELLRWYGTITDIHAWKQAEALATEASASLAATAIERDRAEREVRDQAAALAEADRNKDRFLARLAHEFRNPLGAMQAAIQVLQTRATADPTAVRPLAVPARQSAHLVQLVEDLRDLSLIARGELTLRRQEVDICTTIADAVDTVRPVMNSRGHRLEIGAPSGPIVVTGDPARLLQVFVNVLNNAARYTPRGGVVSVSVGHVSAEVSIQVSDNGIGIASDMLERIFDLYTRTENATAHSEAGIGIGLHLVRMLVRLHAGTVTATSAGIGQGSEFEIRLPLAGT
jgi:signal transduction histidine kinase